MDLSTLLANVNSGVYDVRANELPSSDKETRLGFSILIPDKEEPVLIADSFDITMVYRNLDEVSFYERLDFVHGQDELSATQVGIKRQGQMEKNPELYNQLKSILDACLNHRHREEEIKRGTVLDQLLRKI